MRTGCSGTGFNFGIQMNRNYDYEEELNKLVDGEVTYFEQFEDNWPLMEYYWQLQTDMMLIQNARNNISSVRLRSVMSDEHCTIHTIYMKVDEEVRRRGLKK